jgi:hypothetical protein
MLLQWVNSMKKLVATHPYTVFAYGQPANPKGFLIKENQTWKLNIYFAACFGRVFET